MYRLALLLAATLLPACTQSLYQPPVEGPTATLTSTADDALYNVFYFADAANCADRQWLPFEATRKSFAEEKTVTLPADRDISLLFHRQGAFSYCKIYLTFTPEADADYFISYGAGGNRCGIRMTRGEARPDGQVALGAVRNLRQREFKSPLLPGPGECKAENTGE